MKKITSNMTPGILVANIQIWLSNNLEKISPDDVITIQATMEIIEANTLEEAKSHDH